MIKKLEKLTKSENRRYFLAYNLAKSMTSLVCDNNGTMNCYKITLEDLKEFSEVREILSYFTNNDEAIINKIGKVGIEHKRITDKFELDPNRGDVLFLINVRNYNILKMMEEKKIPDTVTVEVFVYETSVNYDI